MPGPTRRSPRLPKPAPEPAEQPRRWRFLGTSVRFVDLKRRWDEERDIGALAEVVHAWREGSLVPPAWLAETLDDAFQRYLDPLTPDDWDMALTGTARQGRHARLRTRSQDIERRERLYSVLAAARDRGWRGRPLLDAVDAWLVAHPVEDLSGYGTAQRRENLRQLEQRQKRAKKPARHDVVYQFASTTLPSPSEPVVRK